MKRLLSVLVLGSIGAVGCGGVKAGSNSSAGSSSGSGSTAASHTSSTSGTSSGANSGSNSGTNAGPNTASTGSGGTHGGGTSASVTGSTGTPGTTGSHSSGTGGTTSNPSSGSTGSPTSAGTTRGATGTGSTSNSVGGTSASVTSSNSATGSTSGTGTTGSASSGTGSTGLQCASPGSTGATYHGNGTFTHEQLLQTGLTRPGEGVAADVDGDGLPDLLVPDYEGATIAVLRSVGDGTFAAPVQVAASCRPSTLGHAKFTAMAVVDFTGDGKPDLLVGCSGDFNIGEVSLRSNDGAGGFAAKAPLFDTHNTPAFLAAADFNGDGVLDVLEAGALATVGDSDGTLHLGQATGGFHDGASFTRSEATSYAVRDLDGDGVPDVLTVSAPGHGATLLHGVGDGTFTPVALPADLESRSAARVGDVDGDGRADVLSVEPDPSGGERLHVLLGQAGGTFREVTQSLGATLIGLADVNGDGRDDLVTRSATGHTLAIWRSQGDGSFTQVQSIVGVATWAVATDSDGDSQPDLVVGTVSDPVNNIYGAGPLRFAGLPDGSVHGPDLVALDFPATDSVALLIDFDRDGWLDLVGFESGAMRIAFGLPSGAFTPSERFAVAGSYSGLLVDVNGNGRPDLLTQEGGTLSVYDNTGTGLGVAVTTPMSSSPVAANLDCDGFVDLIVGSVSQDGVATYFGNGLGGFTAGPVFSLPQTGQRNAIDAMADLDGDGLTDLLVEDPAVGGLTIYRGKGDGTFVALSSVATTLRVESVRDLDGDGLRDLITLDSYGTDQQAIQVFFNQGGGHFQSTPPLLLSTHGSGQTFGQLVYGDIDGDGRVDALMLLNEVQLLRGTASGFAVGATFSAPGNQALGLADFDHDGKLDLVGYDYNRNALVIDRGL